MIRKETLRAFWVTTVVCVLAASWRPAEQHVRDDQTCQIEPAAARVVTAVVRRPHATHERHVRPLVAIAPASPFDVHVSRAFVVVDGDQLASRHVSACSGSSCSRGPPA